MANDLALPAAFGALANSATALAALDPNWNANLAKPEFGDGIRRGFAIVGLKGKVWRVTFQGVARPVMRHGTTEAAASIDVVLVRSGMGLSKVYYVGGYVEGSQDPPDCFSHDGIAPDVSVKNKPSPTCAACPHNVWGSKVTDQGKPTKACSDSKRLALTTAPLETIPPGSDEALDALDNEVFGGAMLLRVPAASMADLAAYEQQMHNVGFPLHAVVTRLSFDINMAYPKVVFAPVRPLVPDEFEVVMDMRDAQPTKDLLGSAAGDAAFQQEPAPVQGAPAGSMVDAAAQVLADKAKADAAQAKAQAEALAAQQAAQAKAQAEALAAQQAQAQAQAQAAAPAPAAGRRARRGGVTPVEAAPAATQAAATAAAPAPAPDLDDALAAILGD